MREEKSMMCLLKTLDLKVRSLILLWEMTDIADFVLCVVSIVIATITHPLLILKSLIPYLALLVSFALFIFWNDGVVLGDKQNHVATLHLPQLLYLFPFILFFSWPLVLPTCFSIFHAVTRPFFYIYKGVPSTYTPEALDKLKMKIIYTNTAVYIALVAILVIVSKNTIIHPFTLADNRHYVFYIFRYSILRHRYIRELLAPIYLISIVLCYFTLAGPPSISPPTAPASGPNTPSTSTSETKSKSKTATMIGATPSRPAPKSQAMVEEGGIKTSFPFIFLLSTSLCLITAPLVEPRYFILPWIIWRLHLPSPANGPSSFSSKANLRKGKKESGVKARAWLKKGFGKAGKEVQGNWSLWVETAWFLGINAGTGYVFLYWGFEWVQEPGRVQRFMW
jgi:alpha-1,2-glucosyltransferase